MMTYPSDEAPPTVLVELVCRMEDFDEIAMVGEEKFDWPRRSLPFGDSVAPAS